LAIGFLSRLRRYHKAPDSADWLLLETETIGKVVDFVAAPFIESG